jgi:hypothetical protein
LCGVTKTSYLRCRQALPWSNSPPFAIWVSFTMFGEVVVHGLPYESGIPAAL